jgi:hypothetical protein
VAFLPLSSRSGVSGVEKGFIIWEQVSAKDFGGSLQVGSYFFFGCHVGMIWMIDQAMVINLGREFYPTAMLHIIGK